MNIRRAAAFIGAGLAACLMTACGGGGSSSTDAGTPPPAVPMPTTSVAADVPTTGATLQIAQKDVLTVASGTFTSTARTTAAWVNSGDPKALTSQDFELTLPLDKIKASTSSSVTLYFYPDTKRVALAVEAAKPQGLSEGLDTKKLLAAIADKATNVTQLLADVGWDSGRGAYIAQLDAKLLAALTLAANNAPTANLVVRVYDLYAGNLSTATQLYAWNSVNSVVPVDASTALGDRVPLVLVHGIQGIGWGVAGFDASACGANAQYTSTWKKFAERFFADVELHSRYALYTFQYPTNAGIAQNGAALAVALKERFSDKPVVVLSHSMGGLVTRSADVANKARAQGTGIRAVITLDTPHLGTLVVNSVAAGFQMACLGSASNQGALDLAWSQSRASDACGNPLLCGPFGLNRDSAHLSKYVPYAGSFNLPSLATFSNSTANLLEYFSSADWRNAVRGHPTYAAILALQTIDYEKKPNVPGVDSSSASDGVVFVGSQLLQTWEGTRWNDQPAGIFKAPGRRYSDTDHTSIHEDLRVFNQNPDGTPGGIRADLLAFHAEITAVAASITEQPTAVSVVSGQAATFSVGAGGTAPLSYQWRRNGVNVSCSTGSNCASYTTPSVTLNDNGDVYSVVVTNGQGSITSAGAVLTVTPQLTAPVPSAPSGNSTTLTPVFRWSGGSGAANYEINVRDLSTNQLIFRQQGISVSSSSFTMPAGSLANDRSYRWDISACPDLACSSGYVVSGHLSFTTPAAPPASTYALTLSISGSGTVGYGGGLTCANTCSPTFNSGAVVTLTPTAASGFSFTGWSGACSGTGSCVVTMDAAKSVSATFSAASVQQYLLTMSTTGGAGSGSVGYAYGPSSGTCPVGGSCQASLASGTLVSLTATPASGSTFSGWSGACTGTGACSVTMNAAKSVTATFAVAPAQQYLLSMSTNGGTGSGSVGYAYGPSSGNCPAGSSCQANLASGTVVSLTASASTGSTFSGWAGACTGTGACSVTMSAAKSVTASFSPSVVPRPVVTSISPSTMALTSSAQNLVVSGSSFSAGNVVQWATSSGASAGVWGNPVLVVVAAGQITLSIGTDSVPGSYYLRICRSSTATTASDCSSGTHLFTITAPPDLAPGDFGYSFVYVVGRWSTLSIFSFQVSNVGAGAAPATKTRFQFANAAGTVVLNADLNTPALPANSSFVPGQFDIDLASLPAGQYTLTVIVDATGVAGQGNTANDRISKTIPLN